MFYNKQDLEGMCRSKEELNSRLEVEEISKEREITVQECSAKTGFGIWEGIDRMITMFEERKISADEQKDLVIANNKDSSASTQ